MNFTLECERESDGRWLAEVPELPGVLAYGASADEAMAKAELLALRVLAEDEACAHHPALTKPQYSPSMAKSLPGGTSIGG